MFSHYGRRRGSACHPEEPNTPAHKCSEKPKAQPLLAGTYHWSRNGIENEQLPTRRVIDFKRDDHKESILTSNISTTVAAPAPLSFYTVFFSFFFLSLFNKPRCKSYQSTSVATQMNSRSLATSTGPSRPERRRRHQRRPQDVGIFAQSLL
jgi:hypothetical protein